MKFKKPKFWDYPKPNLIAFLTYKLPPFSSPNLSIAPSRIRNGKKVHWVYLVRQMEDELIQPNFERISATS